MSIVITHAEQGIYVGHGLGLGFWSNWDAAGQTQAAVFTSEQEAKEHVASWIDNNDVDGYAYAEVATDSPDYATVDELTAAGLEGMLGELRITHHTFGNA